MVGRSDGQKQCMCVCAEGGSSPDGGRRRERELHLPPEKEPHKVRRKQVLAGENVQGYGFLYNTLLLNIRGAKFLISKFLKFLKFLILNL